MVTFGYQIKKRPPRELSLPGGPDQKGYFMAEQSITRKGTSHHRADRRFLQLFAEDFGIRAFYAFALEGVPKKQALAVAAWAFENIADTEERGEAVRAWARKRKVGEFDPRNQDHEAPTYGGEELKGV
jgi:hypothetical protein